MVNPKVTVELITPEIASRYLALSRGNRSVDGTVRTYSAQIRFFERLLRRGEWKVTPSGVAFDCTGRLIDAHHRLHAIVNTGISAHMMVTRGLSADCYDAIDTGAKPRSVTDVTGIDRKFVEVANLGLFLFEMRQGSVTKRTPEQVESAYNSPLGEAHEQLLQACNTASRIFSSSGFRLAAVLRMIDMPENEQYIFRQYRALILRDYDSMSNISKALVRMYDISNQRSVNTKENTLDRMCKAWWVFDVERSHLKRIILHPESRPPIYEDCRRIIAEVAPNAI
jgi:hypothetical protein